MAITAVVTDEALDITLTGFDRVWALRRRLTIPIEAIESAEVVPRADAIAELRWRVGGTFVPRLVCAGRYTLRSGPGRAFACVYRDAEVLRVRTRLERPRVILLQHQGRHDLAWYIGERIG